MKKTFLMMAVISILGLFTACNNRDNEDIVGKWKCISSEGKCEYILGGEDNMTTFSTEYPYYKDLTFYKNGKADVEQGQSSNCMEDKPSYIIYQYNYSLNSAGDTILLTDPNNNYYPQVFMVQSLTKRKLVIKYVIESDVPEDKGCTYISTYRRK
ncbi:MAG: hypothetical protein IKS33_08675 [Bacteroidales bacterium]|nr:hypothetical protein [Bacteroidales bacterium]